MIYVLCLVKHNPMGWDNINVYLMLSQRIAMGCFNGSHTKVSLNPMTLNDWLSWLHRKFLKILGKVEKLWKVVERVCPGHISLSNFITRPSIKRVKYFKYYVDRRKKIRTISLVINSKKLVQIILKFSQQIVEGYEFVLAKFRWKRLFQ